MCNWLMIQVCFHWEEDEKLWGVESMGPLSRLILDGAPTCPPREGSCCRYSRRTKINRAEDFPHSAGAPRCFQAKPFRKIYGTAPVLRGVGILLTFLIYLVRNLIFQESRKWKEIFKQSLSFHPVTQSLLGNSLTVDVPVFPKIIRSLWEVSILFIWGIWKGPSVKSLKLLPIESNTLHLKNSTSFKAGCGSHCVFVGGGKWIEKQFNRNWQSKVIHSIIRSVLLKCI